jgi:DNA-binding CsgD family transcriptional regulator
MANSKNIIVKESEQELKNLMRQQPIHKKNRVQMLLILKKTQKSLSKIELASILKVNHNTAQKWRKSYFENGIDGHFLMEELALNHLKSIRRYIKLSKRDSLLPWMLLLLI